MALHKLHLTSLTSSVSRFARPADMELLEMNPPYQRGHVWGKDRARNLIRSTLLGIPCGAIILNDRWAAGWYRDKDAAANTNMPLYSVVDGKQRITALHAFGNGQLDVPRGWFDDDDVLPESRDKEMVTIDDLTPGARNDWLMMTTVNVCEARATTLEAEEEVFNLVNHGGVPQGQSDLEGRGSDEEPVVLTVGFTASDLRSVNDNVAIVESIYREAEEADEDIYPGDWEYIDDARADIANVLLGRLPNDLSPYLS